MHPTSPPAAPPRQAPSPAALQKQRAAQGPNAPAGPVKPKVPAVKLTPEQQAKKDAEDAETKRKEQEKIVAINDEWKTKLNDGEIAEVLLIAGQNGKGLVLNDVIQPCGKRKTPKVLNCLPGDVALETGVTAELKKAMIDAQEAKRKPANTKIRIDYGRVVKWEGGSFTGGYVPWGPVLTATKKDIGEKGKPHPVTIFVPNTAHNKAPGQTKESLTGRVKNNSGMTIGAGVDFGSKTDATQRAALKRSAKASGLLTDAETEQLADKFKPYYGLKRTEVCQYLRKHPLNLSQKEIDVVNYESLMSHTDGVIQQYEQTSHKKWTDLTEEEQTFLFSRHYHHGNVLDVAADVGNYEPDKILEELGAKTVVKKGKLVKIPAEREYNYMKIFYAQQAAASTPKAKAHALRQAARAAAKAPKVVADSVKASHR